MNDYDDQVQELGNCIDTLDSLLVAMRMPLGDGIHMSALREALPELREDILKVYKSLGGEWL